MTNTNQNKSIEERIAECRWLKGKIDNQDDIAKLYIDKEHKTAIWFKRDYQWDKISGYRYSKNKNIYGKISNSYEKDKSLDLDSVTFFKNRFYIPYSSERTRGVFCADFRQHFIECYDKPIEEILKGEKNSKDNAIYNRFVYKIDRNIDRKRADIILEKIVKCGIKTAEAGHASSQVEGDYRGDHYIPSHISNYPVSGEIYTLSTKYGNVYAQMDVYSSKKIDKISFAYKDNLDKYRILKALLKKEKAK
jgi:hypothetical protein